MYGQLQIGNALVSMERFELEKALAAVERYRVSHLWVVPPIILALAKQSVVKKYDLSSLKQVGSGAAPLGKDLMEECSRNVPNAIVAQVLYNMFGNHKLCLFVRLFVFFFDKII